MKWKPIYNDRDEKSEYSIVSDDGRFNISKVWVLGELRYELWDRGKMVTWFPDADLAKLEARKL